MPLAAWLDWGGGRAAAVGSPSRKKGLRVGNASIPGTHLDHLAPVCPAQPWEGPQALELNSPDFLGHLNIQEPLQVTVTWGGNKGIKDKLENWPGATLRGPGNQAGGGLATPGLKSDPLRDPSLHQTGPLHTGQKCPVSLKNVLDASRDQSLY